MALSAEPEVRLKLSVPSKRPTWRIIQGRDLKALESELRKRDEYDLAGVTQQGEVFTLFLRHKRTAIRDEESL